MSFNPNIDATFDQSTAGECLRWWEENLARSPDIHIGHKIQMHTVFNDCHRALSASHKKLNNQYECCISGCDSDSSSFNLSMRGSPTKNGFSVLHFKIEKSLR